ncbi:MAG TPA: UDP-3-O-(3-hydroxymyristoyl)glucosamine N-acyltransferase [Blastocatellia bacterium]|jgi:UDP-3-O-[3-hydroxymyristoyl] glucosamine N-acyltransferase|nr:UDP-3-O-(3-hydroxymyristoyl)glucosamine N-acyltransferase [Blastocatellia bacterium]
MRLDEIAERLSCTLQGDGEIEIRGVATLEDATEGDLSFLTNSKYLADAKRTMASAVIVGSDCPDLGRSLLRHKNPYLTFARAIEVFHSRPARQPFVHPSAWVSDRAVIGADVSIDAFTHVADGVIIEARVRIGSNCTIEEGARVGEGTTIHSGSVICHEVVIGRRCIIQPNSVIGADGFGYAKADDGTWYKIIQTGTVVLGDDVEIGACTTIDRATLGQTVVGEGTKLDNLVQIGHGSSVAKNSLLCAQVGLAGSTRIGSNVVLAGQVGSAGHLTIGDGAIVTAQSGVGDDVEPGKVVSGSPAFDNRKWLRSTASFTRLPEIHRAMRDLERRVAKLEPTSQ